MAGSGKAVRTICPHCNYTYEDKYEGKFTTTKCPDCLIIFGMDENGKPTKNDVYYKRFHDVQAFGTDQVTGKPVAIDMEGKRVDPEETRYDLKNDPAGWKATGKKVKGYERK